MRLRYSVTFVGFRSSAVTQVSSPCLVHVKAMAKGDKGILKIAAEFGVGSGTVQRIKAAA